VNAAGQDYYRDSPTLVDLPLENLVEALPELAGLVPAADQQSLPLILSEVGAKVNESYQELIEVVANEQVTQEQCGPSGRLMKGPRQEFNYLIIPHRKGGEMDIEEYRASVDSKPTPGMEPGEVRSAGHASLWALFHSGNQLEARFRYLGEQPLGGRPTLVLAFAQKPGWCTFVGYENAPSGGRRVLVLYQGLAWIDRATKQMLRIRADLLKPRLEVKLELQTTEVDFGEVHISDAASTALWVPLHVMVTTVWNGQVFRDEHIYSNYRLPGATSRIGPAPEETAPPPDK
jgi:hypothetical protein